MNAATIEISGLLAEYESCVLDATDETQNIDWNKLISLLQSKSNWTKAGAESLVSIVRDYGSFVLKNAFALAVATGVEDGRLSL